MKLIKMLFLSTFATILVLLQKSSMVYANYYCCGFENSSMCQGTNVGQEYWVWLNDTAQAPTFDGFNATYSSHYMYLQSPVADPVLIFDPILIDEDDLIMLDVYRNNGSKATLEMRFLRESRDHSNILLFHDIQFDWHTRNVSCGSKPGTIPCCSSYPCNGSFIITANFPATDDSELTAFTNIVINSCTKPIYSNSFCNQLEVLSTDWTITNWTRSQDGHPDWEFVPYFEHNSAYVWTQDFDGGQIISQPATLSIGDRYSFDYYVYSSVEDIENSLLVSVYDMDAREFLPVCLLQDTNQTWGSYTGTCSEEIPCCVAYPCNGKFYWEGSYHTGNTLYAVDNLQMNAKCENSPTCCGFEASSICNMTVKNVSEGVWKWSGNESSNITIADADGDYMWFYEDHTDTFVDGSLLTDTLTIYPNSAINASYYLDIPSNSNSMILVNFISQDASTSLLSTVRISSKSWASFLIYCQSSHANCCTQTSGCVGQIEFKAHHEASESTMFAIDNFQLDSQCKVL